MRIGIYGGCFNPPHIMHKDIAVSLINDGYLDRIIYVPTGDFYPKEGLLSGIDRYNMVSLMIKDLENVGISDVEFGKPTYTYQTLIHFKEKYPNDEIYFVCGSDLFHELETWREYHILFENFNFIVIKRNGDKIEEMRQQYIKFKHKFTFADIVYKRICSTDLRRDLREGKIDLEDKIDKKVLDYIIENKLYRKKE